MSYNRDSDEALGKSLAVSNNAKEQLSMCCQTLCDKSVVERYIASLELEIRNQRKQIELLQLEIKAQDKRNGVLWN